jgi:hypothetical protein
MEESNYESDGRNPDDMNFHSDMKLCGDDDEDKIPPSLEFDFHRIVLMKLILFVTL